MKPSADGTDRAAQKLERAAFAMMLGGILVGLLSLVAAGFEALALPLLGLGLVLTLAVPLGFAMAIGLRRPAALSDRARLAAFVAGPGACYLGAKLVSGEPAAPLVGGSIALAGLLGLLPLLRGGRLRSWTLPTRTLFALLVAAALGWAKPLFEGTSERLYVLSMRSSLVDVRRWQDGRRGSGAPYAAALDSGVALPTGVSVRLAVTPDGYTARARHFGTSAECAVFTGSTALAPATTPGVAACSPRTDPVRDFAGIAALAAIAVATLVAALIGPPDLNVSR